MGASMDVIKNTLTDLPRDIAYIGVALVLLVIATFAKDLMTPFKIREELTAKDNPAVGLSVAGYYMGVMIVCIGPLLTAPGKDVPLWKDLLETAGYTLLGILLLNASRVILDKVLLRDFSTVKEIIEDRNAGTGAVEMGAYIASGLMIAGALHGRGGGPHTLLIMYAVGQVALILYGMLYRVACRYDVHAEIEKDNVAAGVALGLNLIAIGVVMAKGLSGDFKSLPGHLAQAGIIFVIGTVFLLVLRVAVDYALLPGVKIKKEIVEDQNLNAAWVEGAVLAGMAGLLVTVL
jgi:uncharacterized membrane protein YjfL (UPF0719 family)